MATSSSFHLIHTLSLITVTKKTRMNAKMSNFQKKPLRKSDTSIKKLDDTQLPLFLEEFLSNGSKHLIGVKLV